MSLDLEEIEDTIGIAIESITKSNIVGALDAINRMENLISTLEKQPLILQDIKTIKDSLSNNDLPEATEDITKIQREIFQVKTQYLE